MTPTIRDLPCAVERRDEILARVTGSTAAVFLDYDGTLTPIVSDPRAATLSQPTRAAVRALADVAPVAIVSGRDLDDVRAMVSVEGIAYAGSHGFDILAPNGTRHERAPETLPALDQAESELRAALGTVSGAVVERKRYAVAVHFRGVDGPDIVRVQQAVDRVAAGLDALRTTGGKKIFELRPAVPWDKGRALRWLLETLGLDRPGVVPLYVGDDVTDEDAFAVVAGEGIGIVVRGEDDERLTAAHYLLDSPDDVRGLLVDLAASQAGRTPPRP